MSFIILFSNVSHSYQYGFTVSALVIRVCKNIDNF